MISNQDEDEIELENTAMTAIETLTAIETILHSISKKPDLYPPVEQVLYPLLDKLLHQDYLGS